MPVVWEEEVVPCRSANQVSTAAVLRTIAVLRTAELLRTVAVLRTVAKLQATLSPACYNGSKHDAAAAMINTLILSASASALMLAHHRKAPSVVAAVF